MILHIYKREKYLEWLADIPIESNRIKKQIVEYQFHIDCPERILTVLKIANLEQSGREKKLSSPAASPLDQVVMWTEIFTLLGLDEV